MRFDHEDLDPLLGALARLLAKEGETIGVAVLANAEADAEEVSYDGWDGGTYFYTLHLRIPLELFSQLLGKREVVEQNILTVAQNLLKPQRDNVLSTVEINPILSSEADWRDKANAWLRGEGITNQGRVRSDNIASRQCDGLLFRSQPEINLYTALKSRGVVFAPLPVFLRGRKDYRRIEPDFIILKDRMVMMVEVDGDTVHHETPVEAHARATLLVHEGAHLERVKAADCATSASAEATAERLLTIMAKHRSNSA